MHENPSVTIQNPRSRFRRRIHGAYQIPLLREKSRAASAKISPRLEATAEQEVMHAFGHLDLLIQKQPLTPQRALKLRLKVRLTNTPRCIQSSVTWQLKKAIMRQSQRV